jgi:molecular chaperone GrpE
MNERTHNPRNADASAADVGDNVESERAAGVNARVGGETNAKPGPAPDQDQPTSTDTMPAAELIAQLKQECDEFRDQALRARAEFANYQKRVKQQADADRVYAVGTLAKDLLEPLDNLDRAIEALRASGAEGVTAGLDMIQKQLHDILAKHGVEPIPAQGQPFDPNLHDAILQQPSREYPEGTVVAEMSKGYTIRDRVLRPSKVAVSVKPSSQSE